MSMELDLKKWNMRNIQFKSNESKAPVVVLIGKRDTGKSFLVKDLLYYQQHVPVVTVVSGTEEGNGFYGKMVPKLFIHNEYNTAIIENILKRQRGVMKQIEAEQQQFGRSNTDCRTIVCLDDVLYDGSWARDKLMRFLFLNGRHFKVMLIITMQYCIGIPPILRSNIDLVFILRDNIRNNRRKLYENFCGMFPTFEAFSSVMDACTENFECLVVHNNAKSNKLTDQVFWYKADPHPDFRLGSKEFWELSSQFDDESSSTPYDANKLKKKSSGPIINVKKSKWN